MGFVPLTPSLMGFVPKGFGPKFLRRLCSTQNHLFDQDDHAAAEISATERNCILCPSPAFNHHGEPHWEGLEAECFL
jgi:hypothetical protein